MLRRVCLGGSRAQAHKNSSFGQYNARSKASRVRSFLLLLRFSRSHAPKISLPLSAPPWKGGGRQSTPPTPTLPSSCLEPPSPADKADPTHRLPPNRAVQGQARAPRESAPKRRPTWRVPRGQPSSESAARPAAQARRGAQPFKARFRPSCEPLGGRASPSLWAAWALPGWHGTRTGWLPPSLIWSRRGAVDAVHVRSKGGFH